MDIHGWLQNTADRQPPDEEDSPGFPDFLNPSQPQDSRERKHRHKKRPASSERSTPERYHRPQTKRRQAAPRSSSPASIPGHVRRLRPTAASSRTSDSSEGSQAREAVKDKAPDRSYERRARHKTRPDRYDTKPKKRKQERESHHKSKSRSKRRASCRSADVARATGLVQSFHLKNGRQNKRLTLQPNVCAGIFKHGRSSGPVATGSGLPDLVFNEMKFLQRPQEHQDEPPIDAAARKPTKKSKQQSKEEEVSAYFAKKPSTNEKPEKSTNGQAVHEQSNQVGERCEAQSGSRKQNLPPVDLLGQPFLDFGSKDPNTEGNEVHRSSYYTWSESASAQPQNKPSKSPVQTQHLRKRALPPFKSTDSRVHRPSPTRPKGTRSFEQPGAMSAERNGQFTRSNRTKDAAHVEIYREDEAERRTAHHDIHSAAPGVSSESLPKAPIAPVYAFSRDHSGLVAEHDYRTSDILKIRDQMRSVRDLSTPERLARHDDQENIDSSTATPTSNLLRRAFHTVTEVLPEKPAMKDAATTRAESRRVDHIEPKRVSFQQQSAYFDHEALDDTFDEAQASFPSMLRRGFSRSTENSRATERQPLLQVSTLATDVRPAIQRPPNRSFLGANYASIDYEEIGHAPSARSQMHNQASFISSRHVEDLARRLASDHAHRSDCSSAQQPLLAPVMLERRPRGESVRQGDTTDAYDGALVDQFSTEWPSHNSFLGGGYGSDGQARDEQQQQTEDSFTGFWRPNQLY